MSLTQLYFMRRNKREIRRFVRQSVHLALHVERTRRLAAGAPLAIQYTKAAVNKLVKNNLNLAFDHATALEIVTFKSEDHEEALAALKEKRSPEFKGV